MKDNVGGALWRIAIFVTICALGIFAMFAIFANMRFQPARTFYAEFNDVSALKANDFVRIAGVEVGKVKSIYLKPDNTAVVQFTADDTVVLTEGTRAVIRYDDLIGGRYLGLEEGVGSTMKLAAGTTIPLTQTAPALDLDALIGGFRPLFRALDPDQVNALSSQLIQALQGQGATIGSFLNQTAALTNTLADRDQLIGQLVVNLSTVLGSLGEDTQQFDKAVNSLSEIVGTLSNRKEAVSNAVAYGNEAADGVARLLEQARPPLTKVVSETDRTAATVLADKDYFDELINTLPDAYQVLNRQGLYGDYFSFYLCDIVLKLNGKGGQPVFVKMAGQDTGRCAPR